MKTKRRLCYVALNTFLLYYYTTSFIFLSFFLLFLLRLFFFVREVQKKIREAKEKVEEQKTIIRKYINAEPQVVCSKKKKGKKMFLFSVFFCLFVFFHCALEEEF